MSTKSFEYENIEDRYDPEPYFSLLDLYFENNKNVLVKHHINSFNQFIEETIPNILQGSPNVIFEKTSGTKLIRYRLTYDDLAILAPSLETDDIPIRPLDALQRDITYASKYTATVTQWQDTIDLINGTTQTVMIEQPEKDVAISRIPIMVGSKFCTLNLIPEICTDHCRFDQGGYFIIKKSEKVVVSVSSMIQRKPLVFTKKHQNNLHYYVIVLSRSVESYSGNIQTFNIVLKKDNTLTLDITQIKDVSVFVLLRALGLEDDESIVNAILDPSKDKEILNQLYLCMNSKNTTTMNREDAVRNLMYKIKTTKSYSKTDTELEFEQRKQHLFTIIGKNILPHVVSNTDDIQLDMLQKAYYICYMIKKLLKCYIKNNNEVEELRGCDDRDSMINKRIELTGVLLGNLYEQFQKKMHGDLNKIFKTKNKDDKRPLNIIKYIKPNTIQQRLRQALTSGDFGGKNKKGLSQPLNRMNHLHTMSYLRKIVTPTVDASTNKMTSPRFPHNTQYGMIDRKSVV